MNESYFPNVECNWINNSWLDHFLARENAPSDSDRLTSVTVCVVCLTLPSHTILLNFTDSILRKITFYMNPSTQLYKQFSFNFRFYIHTVSQKNCANIFCSVSVKYKPISIKIGRHVPEETFNETVHIWPKESRNMLALFCDTVYISVQTKTNCVHQELLNGRDITS